MENTSRQNDEIDFSVVYNKTRNILSRLTNAVATFFYIIKKRLALLITFFLLGIGAGVFIYFKSKPVYLSSMLLSSSALNNDFCASIIGNLGLLVKDNTPELLAEKLNIDVNTAKQIHAIEFSNYNEDLKKKYDKKDTIVLGLPFKIKVYAGSTTVFDTLQQALVDYLENNEYALKRKDIKTQEIKLMREKLKNEIYELDSLKNIVASNLAPRGNQLGFVFGQPINPVEIYREGIGLFQKDMDLNRAAILNDNIQVIDGFFPRSKPDSPKLVKTLVIGAVIGSILGLLVTFFLETRKRE